MSAQSEAPALDARRQRLQEDFVKRRGYWTPWLEGILRLSPDFFEAFLAFTGTPWASGPLPPKVKEFIYIAIDGAVTHFYQRGLKMHIAEASRHGASPAEIMELLQLASVLGIHTCSVGVPLLSEEMARVGQALV
jgi:hypothetical protein